MVSYAIFLSVDGQVHKFIGTMYSQDLHSNSSAVNCLRAGYILLEGRFVFLPSLFPNLECGLHTVDDTRTGSWI